MIPDYYSLLEIKSNASAVEMKRAYHRLARLHHPDLNSQAQDRHIKLLNEAYAVLSNPQRRAAYDESLARQRAAQLPRQPPEMTWVQGMAGFVRELKKGMRDD